MTFGPTSVFAGKNKEGKRDSISRTNSSSNMFSMLQAAEAAEPAPKAPEPQRKRLILQPRTVPAEGDASAPKSPSESSASEDAEVEEDAGGMSEEAAETKIKEDVKEFFAIRSIDEAEAYWTALPAAHHHRLIDKLISQAVEAKEADAQLVADLFKSVVSKELCASDAFERGFVNIANFIEDIAIDAPKAVTFFGRIVKAVELDEEQRRRLADKASEGHEDEGKEEYAERILKAIS
jgi:translation initiation factor 4G